jgi:lincosamide nucleotidyltransferase A/C/D/E
MTSLDVLDFYKTMSEVGVEVWVDGGWGVDALLGKQTRSHKDLDIAIQEKHVALLRDVLLERGFTEVRLEDARLWNFVLGDEAGREIDVHVIVLDNSGNGVYGPPEKGEMYPAASLAGSGIIDGQRVRCISPEWAVKFHSGYGLKEKDFRDVSALCQKFGIELPPIYERFRETE